MRDVIGPLSRGIGERIARSLGVTEDLAVRLERLHSPLDVTAFRLRQVGWSVAGFAVAALIALTLQPPPVVGLILVLAGPLLVFLVLEQRLASASDAWKRRLFLELPVVAEQLAMLLSAGYSLSAALNRLSVRGTGHAAKDLARVCGRIRQGLSEVDALREWAAVAEVEALNALSGTFAERRAGKAVCEGRHPDRPTNGLVCISDKEEAVENRRTKAFVGVQRVRHYAYKRNLRTGVAVQVDDGPLQWVFEGAAPPQPPTTVGILRRWPRGARPAASS